MLSCCKLLKHKILIGLLYGCGLRCLEVRNLRLCDLDFDPKQLKVVQGKGKKDRYLPLSEHLIRGLKNYIEAEKPGDFLFGEPRGNRAGGEFDSRYSQRGVQWAVKQAFKISKNIERSECSYASPQFCDASSGRWDGYFEHQKSSRSRKY